LFNEVSLVAAGLTAVNQELSYAIVDRDGQLLERGTVSINEPEKVANAAAKYDVKLLACASTFPRSVHEALMQKTSQLGYRVSFPPPPPNNFYWLY